MSAIITDRAITLTCPWANAVALEVKRLETRGKPTKYRGWVAIHAAKGWTATDRKFLEVDPYHPDLADALGALSGKDSGDIDVLRYVDESRGKVLCVVRLVDCLPTSDFDIRDAREAAWGNYAPGRFFFDLKNVRRLREPFMARGFQSIPWKLPQPITEDMLVA